MYVHTCVLCRCSEDCVYRTIFPVPTFSSIDENTVLVCVQSLLTHIHICKDYKKKSVSGRGGGQQYNTYVDTDRTVKAMYISTCAHTYVHMYVCTYAVLEIRHNGRWTNVLAQSFWVRQFQTCSDTFFGEVHVCHSGCVRINK